jgi:hypothetical protein
MLGFCSLALSKPSGDWPYSSNKRVQPTSCVGHCMEYHGQRARLTRYDVRQIGGRIVEEANSGVPAQPAASVGGPHVLWRQVTGLVVWVGLWVAFLIVPRGDDRFVIPLIVTGALAALLGVAVFADAWFAGIHKVESSKSQLNMSPMAWGFTVAFCFPIFCPVYLLNRCKLRTRESSPVLVVVVAGLWGSAVVAWVVLVILRLSGTV